MTTKSTMFFEAFVFAVVWTSICAARPDFSRVSGFGSGGGGFSVGGFRVNVGGDVLHNARLRALDFDSTVSEVSCSDDFRWLRLRCDGGVCCGGELFSGDVVSGGAEWGGCGGVPFLRRVVATPAPCADDPSLLCVETAPATLADAFETLSLRISRAEDLPPNFAESFALLSPQRGESFVAGAKVDIAWHLSSLVEGTPVLVELLVSDGTVPNVSQLVARVDARGGPNGTTHTAAIANSSWPQSCLYFVRVFLCDGGSCSKLLFDGESADYYFCANSRGTQEGVGLVNPRSFDVFHPGDTVTVKWEHPPSETSSPAWIRLWARRSMLPDRAITSGQWVTLGDGASGINWTVPGASILYESDEYYWELQFHCSAPLWWCGDVAYGDRFSVRSSDPPKELLFVSPDGSEAPLSTGDELKIDWRGTGFSSADKLYDVSLLQEGWSFDSVVQVFATDVDALQGSLVAKIGHVSSPGSGFYVKIRYACGVFWCASAESKRFAIDQAAEFELLDPTPPAGSIISEGTPIVVRWRAKTLPSSTPVFVRLQQRWPSWLPIDPTLSGDSSRWTTAGAGEVTLKPSRGAAFPVYLSFSHNCLVGSWWCTTEASPEFNIPLGVAAAWNIDPASGRVLKPTINFAAETCPSGCKLFPLSPFCQLCKLGIDLRASVDCVGCYTLNSAQLSGLALDISLSKLTYFALEMSGTSSFRFAVKGSMAASFDHSQSATLWKAPVLGFEFYIGKVQVVLGVVASVEESVDVSTRAAAAATAELDGVIVYSANVIHGTGNASENGVNVNITVREVHEPTLDLAAATKADVLASLTARLKAEMTGIVSLDAAARASSKLEAAASWPAFSALPTHKLRNSSIWGFGDCAASPHLVRYALSASGSLSARAVVLPPSGTAYERGIASPVIEILSGCLGQTSGQTLHHPAAVFARALEPFPPSDLALGANLTEAALQIEVADMLNTPSELVFVVLHRDVLNLYITGMSVIFAPLLDGSSATGPDTIALARSLERDLLAPISSFYSSTAGSQLQGKLIVVPQYDDSSSGSNTLLVPVAALVLFFAASLTL